LADSGAFKLIGAVQTLEYAAKPVPISHVEAHTVVAYENHRFCRLVTAHFSAEP
jgi:hypothetical protein